MANTSDERRPADEVMGEIHDRVDMQIVDEIQEVLKSHPGIKTSTVSAIFAYLLADAIAQNSTHEEICRLCEAYGEYVHRCAHGLKMTEDAENGDTKVIFVNVGEKMH